MRLFEKNNILHRIKIVNRMKCSYHFSYDEYNGIDKGKYFNKTGLNYEKNKIMNIFNLYIEVYKGFTNLFDKKYLYQNSDIKTEIEKPKFGIYLYPDWKALNKI
jgi:NAD-specific glutamate dehydrogenase